MRRIWAIFQKELKHIVRDRRTFLILLILPVVMMFLFAYALTFDVKNIRMAVQDGDISAQSRRLIDSFETSNRFQVARTSESLDELNELIRKGEVEVGLSIPPDFSSDLKSGKKATVGVILDGSNPIIARVAFGYITAISQSFSKKIILSDLSRKGLSFNERGGAEGRSEVLYNPDLASFNFIVPGLIALLLMMIPAVLTSVAIVREKERRTVEQIIVSPVKPFELMLGKILPYLLIASFDALLISLVGILWFGVPFRGSALLLILLTVLYMMTTLAIGIFISTVAETQLVAQLAAFLLTMLPSFMLSGFVFPILSMPKVLQYITYVVPARYYLVILKGIFLKGVGIGVLWPEALSLSFFALILVLGSSLRFRKGMV